MKGKYLITTDNWFIAPDGQEYRSVWGDVQILEDSVIGVKTNARSTNWYAKVGATDHDHVIVAGCQIHYAVRCEEPPSTARCVVHNDQGQGISHPSRIYITDIE